MATTAEFRQDDLPIHNGGEPGSGATYAARKFISDVQMEFSKAKRKYLLIVFKWLSSYEFFSAFEQDVVYGGSPSQSDLAFHQGTAEILHGLGVQLLKALEAHEQVVLREVGIRYEDLAAMVEELGSTARSYTSSFSGSQMQALEAIFCSSEG